MACGSIDLNFVSKRSLQFPFRARVVERTQRNGTISGNYRLFHTTGKANAESEARQRCRDLPFNSPQPCQYLRLRSAAVTRLTRKPGFLGDQGRGTASCSGWAWADNGGSLRGEDR